MSSTDRRLRVLVVDDEALIVWALSETLRRRGHTVVEASSARAAREEIGHAPSFDVALLDYRLPDSNGIEVLEDLRRRSPGTAVILMTAFGSPEVVQAAMERGAHCVVSKPFDMNDVEGLVQEAYQDGHLHQRRRT